MNYWIQSGNATSDVTYNKEKQAITLSTNLYPDYLIFEGTFAEDGPYSELPQPQAIEQHTLTLIPAGSSYINATINSIDIARPTMFELGLIGRPSNEATNNAHWSAANQPLEILDLDPISVEAWDMPAHRARENYAGLLRFNVAGIDKSSDSAFSNFTLYDGSRLGLTNDYYGAHTQPGGAYHLHHWGPGEELEHSNKVIGYVYDDEGSAFPMMGLGSKILAPILDNNNHLIDYDNSVSERSAASGYGIRSDYVEARRGKTPQNGTLNAIPSDAPGIFHVDYIYQGEDKSSFDKASTYLLDAYNMGFVTINGVIQKAYVQTEDYPYTIHTVYEPTFASEPTPGPAPTPEPEPEDYEPPTTKKTIKGSNKDDTLRGTKKSDFITGKKGDDKVTGSNGNDVLQGDQGNDILKGSKGKDYLDGSKGVDILIGGKGADVFQISKGVDLVEDFSIKQGDKVALDKKEKYSIIDDSDGVLIVASAKKQLFLEGVDYDDVIAAGGELFVQIV